MALRARRRRELATVGAAVLVALLVVLAGCGGDDGSAVQGDTLDEAEFAALLQEESALSEEQASCIAERSFDRLPPDGIAAIVLYGPSSAADAQTPTEYAWITTACITAYPPAGSAGSTEQP